MSLSEPARPEPKSPVAWTPEPEPGFEPTLDFEEQLECVQALRGHLDELEKALLASIQRGPPYVALSDDKGLIVSQRTLHDDNSPYSETFYDLCALIKTAITKEDEADSLRQASEKLAALSKQADRRYRKIVADYKRAGLQP